MPIEANENFQNTGRTAFWDNTTFETIRADYPIQFYDEFDGYSLQKYTANENTTSKWRTVETALNTAIAVVADDHFAALILDSDDNAEVACLHFGDQECYSLERGVMWEARVTFPTLPLTGTETVQAVFGLAGAHNTTLDSIDCNAWFRVESAANTTLLWETDDNVTNDDDNSAGVALVASTWNIFRIHAVTKQDVRFYVDGVLVATSNMSGLTAAIGDVQPYFNVSKAKSSENTGTGTMYIDYCRVWENRT